MCCESETKSTTTVPGYIEEAGKSLVSQGQQLASTDYQSNPLQIADFSPDQQTAFQQVRDIAANPNISTERIVDEGGRLGAVSDYMNPYLERALAPALRQIQEAEDANRKRIGAGATSAGAFGDARHGIVESMNARDAQLARGETAAKFYKDAFDTVMTQRGQDLSRFTDVDKTNFGNALQAVQALLTTGGQQQGLDQAKNQAIFDDFLRQYGHDFAVLEALGAAISGTPYSTTTTQTSPDNGILQALGAGGAALAGNSALPAVLAAI